MNILNIEHVSKLYGDKWIFDDISCGIQEGEKIGIIGINGTGKTTLLRIIAGTEEPDQGQEQVAVQVGVPELPRVHFGVSVVPRVRAGLPVADLRGFVP